MAYCVENQLLTDRVPRIKIIAECVGTNVLFPLSDFVRIKVETIFPEDAIGSCKVFVNKRGQIRNSDCRFTVVHPFVHNHSVATENL